MGHDEIIFLLVVAARLIIPLFIFRFPLPAIVAALVIDAADQTIFQNRTNLDLTGYQGYDKSLDVYYLAIAYLSTFRNWRDPFAARTAQFLWFYRLVGVVLFELLQVRALLLIFPNTFEYFFICYEVVRLAWNPERLSHRQVIGLAAIIWIFVKLPQEWWIHVAQLDFTDFMKETVFGGTVDQSWGELIGDNLWFIALMVVLVVVVVVVARWAIRSAPAPDWRPSMDVERHPQSTNVGLDPQPVRMWEWDLLEKALFTSLVAIIFAQVIPGTESTPLQIAVLVSIVVVANAWVSQWLARRGRSWDTTGRQFAAMVVINGLIVLGIAVLRREQQVNFNATVFLLLLLTLIITLYDRYRPIRSARYPAPVTSGA